MSKNIFRVGVSTQNHGPVRVVFVFLLWVLTFPTSAQIKGKPIERPKLVVGIVVDQMRYDYLYRYYDRYTDGGFKRLLKTGFSCENTYITYVSTQTAIGHSTIYTGSIPAIHGITGNEWIEQQNGKRVYCTKDSGAISVGTDNPNGSMSPKNLLVTTVTDELKLATNYRSKTIGIALKDRGSILPAGHFADAAYWYDGTSGNWITSDYYQKELPAWVLKFNAQKLPEKLLANDWHTLFPIETYLQSIEDNNEYEGKFKGTKTPVLPVMTSQLVKEYGYSLIHSVPAGNTFTLSFAKEAIENENLGKNPAGVPDFLAVSLSTPDYIGHQFIVNSIEIEDTYLRLDQELSWFFQYLDKSIGKGNYTLFLTADHGAAHNPQFMIDRKGSAGYFNANKVQKELNEHLKNNFDDSALVLSLLSYQVHFNNTIIKAKGLEMERIKQTTIAFLKNVEGVQFVTDMEKTAAAAIPSLLKERIINGYNFKRSGAIQIILEPQFYSGSPRAKGTSHGTWNPYDAHIPLIWMGWGIQKGSSHKSIGMVDIAPTISALLHIQEPNGNTGTPLTEILDVK